MRKIQFLKRKNTEKNDKEKQYEMILSKIIKNKYKLNKLEFERINVNVKEFKDYFLNNEKISRFLAVFLPCIIFLIISLVSFSLAILSQNTSNLGFASKVDDFWILFIFWGLFFLILSCVLFIQNQFLKIKVVKIKNGRQKGYHNISKKRHDEIMDFLIKNE